MAKRINNTLTFEEVKDLELNREAIGILDDLAWTSVFDDALKVNKLIKASGIEPDMELGARFHTGYCFLAGSADDCRCDLIDLLEVNPFNPSMEWMATSIDGLLKLVKTQQVWLDSWTATFALLKNEEGEQAAKNIHKKLQGWEETLKEFLEELKNCFHAEPLGWKSDLIFEYLRAKAQRI